MCVHFISECNTYSVFNMYTAYISSIIYSVIRPSRFDRLRHARPPQGKGKGKDGGGGTV